MAAKKLKNTLHNLVDQNPIEAFRDIGGGIANSFTSDLLKGGASDFWNQFLGGSEQGGSHKVSGELKAGQELNLASLSQKKEQTKRHDIEPGLDYRREILYGEKRISQENNRELESQIHEIVVELKRIVSSSEVLQATFKDVASQTHVVKPGKYHLSFFGWLLSQIRTMRISMEDTGAALGLMKGKKAKKDYWSQFKKHGTSFGLSNERTVATQTG